MALEPGAEGISPKVGHSNDQRKQHKRYLKHFEALPAFSLKLWLEHMAAGYTSMDSMVQAPEHAAMGGHSKALLTCAFDTGGDHHPSPSGIIQLSYSVGSVSLSGVVWGDHPTARALAISWPIICRPCDCQNGEGARWGGTPETV